MGLVDQLVDRPRKLIAPAAIAEAATHPVDAAERQARSAFDDELQGRRVPCRPQRCDSAAERELAGCGGDCDRGADCPTAGPEDQCASLHGGD
jgi:hypothetical protein